MHLILVEIYREGVVMVDDIEVLLWVKMEGNLVL